MSYSAEGFNARAEECVRLANFTDDAMIQRELLQLRQVYLQTSERLQKMETKKTKK